MWFAFVKSPLGINVRVSKKFIAAVCINEQCRELAEVLKGPYDLREIRVSGVDDLYLISALDPDSADLIKLGVRDFLVACLK